MSSFFDRELNALDEVEDLLEAYAEARLNPQGAVLARIRAQILLEARAVERTMSPAAILDTDLTERPRWTFGRFSVQAPAMPSLGARRRGFAVAGASMLAVVMSTAVLAAPAGSPFFDFRVAVGGAFLPSDVDDRLAAHEQRLADWLFEAQLAAARGDLPALQDALDAYRAEVAAAVSDVDTDADRLAHLESMLATHAAVLTALAVDAPEPAAIDTAIDASQKAIVKIKEKGTPGAGRPSQPPANPNAGPPDRN